MELTTQQEKALVLRKEDLARLNELASKLEKWREEYSTLTIAGISDKEGRENVRKAIATLRTERTSLEDNRKILVAPYNQTLAFVNDKFADAKLKILSIEEPLKEMKKRVDDEEDQIKEQKRLEKAQKLANRVDALTKNGCSFDGEYYSIKDDELGIAETSLGIVDLENMSDELFEKTFKDVVEKNNHITLERERIDEENRIAEEKRKEKERLESERIERESAALKEKADKMNTQVFNFRLKQLNQVADVVFEKDIVTVFGSVLGSREYVYSLPDEEFDSLLEKLTLRADNIKKEEAEKQRLETIKKERISMFVGLGFKLNPTFDRYDLFIFSNKLSVTTTQIVNFTDSEFESFVDNAAKAIAQSKDAEQKYNAGKERADYLKLIESYNNEDITELGSMSVVDWNKLYSDRKAKYDNAIKQKIEETQRKEKEQQELLKKEELEKASDKEKWANFISQLQGILAPEMKNSTYRNKLKIAKEKIEEIINL